MSLARTVRLLALLSLAPACAGPPRPSPAAPPAATTGAPAGGAALHHEVTVVLDPGARRIAVEDRVTLSPALRARTGDTVGFSLHAALAPERVGPGAPLAPARPAAGAAASREDAPEVPLERYEVKLGRGERTFTVRYGGEVFHPIVPPGQEHARSTSESAGLVSGDGAVLTGATAWLPDVPDALVTFALEARVPAGWEAVSQGARTRHERGELETTARWECPEPQEEVFLVAGPFFERSRQAGRVLVQTFLREDDPKLSDSYLETGARYLAMYERLLGPYPYAKFALVENFWETGYGMPSFTLLGPRIVRFPFILHSSYPHEILHDWWGNGVFVDPSRGNWSEGLTAYLADHLVQEGRGEGAEYRRSALQKYADHVARNADFAVRDFRARHDPVTQAVGYDKVLMVFHMLRRRMGDERFVAGLRRFYGEERFRPASFDDLARAMSAAAGEDLAPFFAQWVDRPGAPALRLEGVTGRRGERGYVLELVLAQEQEGAPYEVDVPVCLTFAAEPRAVTRTLRLRERRQRFEIELPEAPARVDVDPEYDVFRRLDPSELPAALSGAFGAEETLIVLPSSAPAELGAAYAALAESWKRPGIEVVSDADVAAVPAGKAAWILGWENRLRGAVGVGLEPLGGELSDAGLRAGETVLSRADRSVVAAVRSPADPRQVVAFLGAQNPKALPGLARKLPHYGKYGLLGFEGDEPANTAKRVWPVPRSHLTMAAGGSDRLPPRAAAPPRRPLAELPPAAAEVPRPR